MKKTHIIVLALLGLAAIMYFGVIPKVKDHFHQKTIVEKGKEKEIAILELEIAKLQKQAEMTGLCTADQVNVLLASNAGTDGGSKPNLAVTATIKATKGHFILEPTIKLSHAGSDRYREEHSETTTKSHSKYKDSLFKNIILQEASYKAFASKGQRIGRRAVAVATIAAKEYSLECVDYLLKK